MAQVKTFYCKIKDEYGQTFPQALVAVRAFSEMSQNTGSSEDCEGEYFINGDTQAITYSLNYWYSDAHKAEGYRSRPFKIDNDGTLEDVIVADLTDAEVIGILSDDLDPMSRVLSAIKSDAVRKNS